MKRLSRLTPEGSRDYLFEECDDRRNIEKILADLFKESSYKKVITPSIEFFDVFRNESTVVESDEMYKLTDSKGRTTVLRPDNTMPIARMVATRLNKEDFPVRLYYNQNVFVRGKDLDGRPNEIAQNARDRHLHGVRDARGDRRRHRVHSVALHDLPEDAREVLGKERKVKWTASYT